MTELIAELRHWRELRRGPVFHGRTLGFVPTMGNLHEGHLSLIRRSRAENELTVVSIFVNQTQFDDPVDLRNYPRTLAEDLGLADQVGVDYVLHPSYGDMYPDDYRFRVHETMLSSRFCGAFRPGHFSGVLTVVLKLINLTRASRAYFGEKDYQQYLLIRDMAQALFLDTAIVACPVVRDQDGLAFSSRNRLLNPEQRRLAVQFPRILRNSDTCETARRDLETAGFRVDYVDELDGRRLGAVRVGPVRLIDNVVVPGRKKSLSL